MRAYTQGFIFLPMKVFKIILNLTLIISLLLNSAGPGYMPRAQSRGALRPLAVTCTSRTLPIENKRSSPVLPEFAPKSFSAGEALIVDEMKIDLEEGVDDIWLELLDRMDNLPEGHRILLRSPIPGSVKEFETARRLGFVMAVSAEELASVVSGELKRQKAFPGKKPYSISTTSSMEFGFKDKVDMGGFPCKSITLLCLDSSISSRFKSAFTGYNYNDIAQLIRSGQVEAIGVPMVMRDNSSLNVLTGTLDLDNEQVNRKLISEEGARALEKEEEKRAKYQAENKAIESLLSEIDQLLDKSEYNQALLLLAEPLHITRKAWQEAEQTRVDKAFEKRKARAVLALADKELSADTPDEAVAIIGEHFRSSTEISEVRAKLDEAKKAVAAKERREKEIEAEQEDTRIQGLIERGSFDDAYTALQEAGKRFRGLELFSNIKERLTRVVSIARQEDPLWIPSDEKNDLLEVALSYTLEHFQSAIASTNKRDSLRAYRKAGQILKGSLLDMIEALPEPLFNKILQEVRFSIGRQAAAMKKSEYDIILDPSIIPETKEGLRKLCQFVRNNPPSMRERLAVKELPKEEQAQHPLMKDRNVRILMWHFTAAITDTHYDRYLDGTVAKRVSLHPRITSEDIDKQQKAHGKQRRFLAHEIASSMKALRVPDCLEPIAASLRQLLESDEPLCLIRGLGGGAHPSLVTIKAFIQLGAMPAFSPKDLAKRLDRENIESIDILTVLPKETPVIRIIMKREHIFNGPVSPAPIIYLYLYDPKAPEKAMKLDEVKKCVDNWEGTLKRLSLSKWDASNPAFLVGGVDYDWQTKASVKSLVSKAFPEASPSRQTDLTADIWKAHKKFEERYAAEAGLVTDEARRFMDSDAIRLITSANYFYDSQFLYGLCPESWKAAKDFIKALMEPGCEDLAAQVGLVRAREGKIFSRVLCDELPGPIDEAFYVHYIEILHAAIAILNEWKSLADGGREDLLAPWSVLTGWDEDAPREETAKGRESYTSAWQARAEMLRLAISIYASDAKIFDRMVFKINDAGHPVDARNLLSIARELGYRPFIKDDQLIRLIEDPDAVSSIEIVEGDEEYPPAILFGLNKEAGWSFITEKIRDFPEEGRSRFGFVLTEGGEALRGADFDKAAGRLVGDGKLLYHTDGESLLAKAIKGGTACMVAVHVLHNGEELAAALFKGTEGAAASKVSEKILREIKKIQNHIFDLDEIMVAPYEQRIIDEAMAKISRSLEGKRLKQALNVANRALAKLRINKGEALLAEKDKISRIKDKNILIERAEVVLKRRSLDAAIFLLAGLEAFLCGEVPEVTEAMVAGTDDAKADPNILKVWKRLKRLIRLDEERRELLREAAKLLGHERLTEARVNVEQAVERSGEGPDTDELFERLVAAGDETLKKDVDGLLKKLARSMTALEQKSATEKEAGGLYKETLDIQRTIETISSIALQQELFEQLEELRDGITGIRIRIKQEQEETRNRLRAQLKSLRVEIPAAKDRERLTELGRTLRRIKREIEHYDGRGKSALAESCAEIEPGYGEKQKEINQAIEKLRHDVRQGFEEARQAIDSLWKKLLINMLGAGVEAAKKSIAGIPSSKVRQDLASELNTWKKKLKSSLDEIAVKEIKEQLLAVKTRISEIDEKETTEEDVKGIFDEEEATEKIMGIADQGRRDRLFLILDDIIAAKNDKILGIEQQKLIDSFRGRVDMLMTLIRGAEPIKIEIWLATKGTNSFTAIQDALDQLDRDCEISRRYAEGIESEIERIVEERLRKLSKQRSMTRAPRRPVARPAPEKHEDHQVEAAVPEARAPKKQVKVPSVSAFRERIAKAKTKKDRAEIAVKLGEVISSSGISGQQLNAYVELLAKLGEELVSKPPKSSSAGVKEAEAYIRRITDQAEVRDDFDLADHPAYAREFYNIDLRERVYHGLLRPDGKSSILDKMIRGKRVNAQRVLRVWVPGCSTGEELRTMVWLVRKALGICNERVEDWKLQFYGTDKIKNLIEAAGLWKGKPDKIYQTVDRKDFEEVRVGTSGFDIEYLIVDHSNKEHLDNWVSWQKEIGNFDMIFLHDKPSDKETERMIRSLLRKGGYYAAGGKLYKKKEVNRFDEIDSIYMRGDKIKPLVITAKPVQAYYWLRFIIDKKPRTLVIFDKARSQEIGIAEVDNRTIDNNNWLFWAMKEGFVDKVYYFSQAEKQYSELSINIEPTGYSIKAKGDPILELPEEALPKEGEPRELLALINHTFFTESEGPPFEGPINDILGFFDSYRSFVNLAILCHSRPDYTDETEVEKNRDALERILRPMFISSMRIASFLEILDMDAKSNWYRFARIISQTTEPSEDYKTVTRSTDSHDLTKFFVGIDTKKLAALQDEEGLICAVRKRAKAADVSKAEDRPDASGEAKFSSAGDTGIEPGLQQPLVWTKAKEGDEITFSGEVIGNLTNLTEVTYKGEHFWAKFGKDQEGIDGEADIIIPQAKILHYLKNKTGLCEEKKICNPLHFLEVKRADGAKIKMILFEPFPKGKTLRDKIRNGGLIPEDEAVNIMIKVSEIIKELLDEGVFHWDIAAKNIWITDDGEVMIFSFNIAFRNREEFLRRELYSYGTGPYMSKNRGHQAMGPEQPDEWKYYSPSDEIYSLGILMCELMASGSSKLKNRILGGRHYIEDIWILYERKSGLPRKLREVLRKVTYLRMSGYNDIDIFIAELKKCARRYRIINFIKSSIRREKRPLRADFAIDAAA